MKIEEHEIMPKRGEKKTKKKKIKMIDDFFFRFKVNRDSKLNANEQNKME